jgi:cell division protein FtsL
MKVLLIALLVVFGMFLVSFIFNLCFKSKIDKQKAEIKRKEEAYEGAVQEVQKLLEAQKIKGKNDEKAKEKISDLHSGKLSADDILPKC